MAAQRLITTSEGTHADAYTPLDWGLIGFAGLTWGASFLFIAEGLEAFSPGLVTFGRILFGFLALSCAPRARRPVAGDDWPRIVALGVVWMAFPLSMFPLAEQRVTSAVAGMLNGAVPIFAAAVATVLLRRPPGRAQLIGLTVGAAGVACVGLPSVGRGSNSAVGVGLILLALCAYGIAINLAVPLQQRYGALPVLWRALGVALVLTAPFGLAGLGDARWELGPSAAVVVLGVGGTGLAFVAATTLAGRVGSTRASTVTYLTPPVAVALGVVVRDERVAALALVGTVLVITGAYLASRADARQKSPAG